MNFAILKTPIRSEHDILLTRQRARQIAHLFGFDLQDQTRIATAVSEIARNAVQHGGGGTVEFQLIGGTPQILQIRVKDNGPGIADADDFMNAPPRLTYGTGAGIRGVRRLMDTFHIQSVPTHGTEVLLGKRLPRSLPPIGREEMASITHELMERVSEDPLAELQRQNQELLRTLEDLRIQQEERNTHLQEIELLNMRLKRSVRASHHRVKNNLQIISALVEVQTTTEEETVPVSAMLRVGQHARALATLHDLLTQETRSELDEELVFIKSVLDKLLPLLQVAAGGRQIVPAIDDFALPLQNSGSLILLISELISNAVKHGEGNIGLTLKAQGSTAQLEVRNEGPGFPPDFDWRQAANVGFTIIDSTARFDLKGTLSFENPPEGGARVLVCFPITEVTPTTL